MKITEALCNVITEAGGTPTTDDADSVTHALGTLYTTLGGTDELPNYVAERINGLSDHIGGGGTPEVTLSTIKIKNNTSGNIALYGLVIKEVDGVYYAMNKNESIGAGASKDVTVPYGVSVGSQYNAFWSCRCSIRNTVDPTKVTATSNFGTVRLVRSSEDDTSVTNMFVISIAVTGSSATEQVVVTISVTE